MMRLVLALSMFLSVCLAAPRQVDAQATAQPPDQSLAGVSCPTPTWCMAVGSQSVIQYGVGDVNTHGLAERWDGSRWTEMPLPQPAAAISCTSPAACTAVGGTTAERWDGTAWTVQSVPLPPDSNNPGLSGVSCISATFCVAVGGYQPPSTNGAPPPWYQLIEAWNGSDWSTQTPPAPPGPFGGVLTNVSCSSPAACTAIGKFPTNSAVATVAERWDGSTWTEQPAPGLAAYPGMILTGISCTSAAACMAIASGEGSPFQSRPVAAQWNGTYWSFQEMALPAGIYNWQLNALSCSAETSCVAVGFYTSWSGPILSLVERWDGSAWTVQPAPVPAGGSGGLTSVACSSAVACVAVGSVWFNSWGRLGVTEGWNGASWAIQPGPYSRSSSSLEAVSCSSATWCLAVGNQQNASGIAATLAGSWNGHAWTTRPTPNPAGALSSSLEAVSCSSPVACIAVGSTLTADGTWLPLAERWNGSVWTLQATHDPESAGMSALSGVACTSARACLAVGSQQLIGADSVPLVERWDGTSWTLVAIPMPKGAAAVSLSAISCSSASACTAAGSMRYGDDPSVPAEVRDTTVALVARWNGSTWSQQRIPPGIPRSPSGFSGVSCPDATTCFVLGIGTNSTYTNITISERWNGKRWSKLRYPNPYAGTAGTPESISCSSPSACSAVSFTSITGSGFISLVGRWNGKMWRVGSPQVPLGALQAQLIGASCPTSSVCMTAGHYIDASGNQLTLADRWNGRAWFVQPTS